MPTHAIKTEIAIYQSGPTPFLPATLPPEPADVASYKRDNDGNIKSSFQEDHEAFLRRGQEGPIGLLFLGDSITAGWSGHKDLWQQYFGQYNPANFGIGGDRTQHVLWRIENGELEGIEPQVVVLLIGTNNMAWPGEGIARAVKKVVQSIHQKLPSARVLLLGILPRGADANHPLRAKIKSVNTELAALDDGNMTRFLDLGDKFLESDGSISEETMPDALHLSVKGYQIWADGIQPLLDNMMIIPNPYL
jgi:beta-glucosidase